MTEAAKRDSGILDKVGGWKRAHVAKNESRWGPAWRWLRLGVRKPPRPAYRGLYEPADPRRRGVCCSGGGVRSAAFNLGALQALQDKDELQKTEYLSAVSGGSYIASAFCMVAKTREQAGLDPALFSRQKGLPFAPGTPEEQYLRNHLSLPRAQQLGEALSRPADGRGTAGERPADRTAGDDARAAHRPGARRAVRRRSPTAASRCRAACGPRSRCWPRARCLPR